MAKFWTRAALRRRWEKLSQLPQRQQHRGTDMKIHEIHHELEYFFVEGSLGGQQEFFKYIFMRLGGCAADTACDLSIWLARTRGLTQLYPFDPWNLTLADFREFGEVMKPYLHPRWHGVDKLDIYLDGYGQYLRDHGVTNVQLTGFDMHRPVAEAQAFIQRQLDDNLPVPMLMLKHKSVDVADFVWHWFMLAGYVAYDHDFFVKLITYGNAYWFNLRELWNTGYDEKGGLIGVTVGE